MKPLVGNVDKFVRIRLNYSDPAFEAGVPIPGDPIFLFEATSAVCGPNDEVIIPLGATKTDGEVELGVVIGRKAWHVSEGDAAECIGGYCMMNGVSERD